MSKKLSKIAIARSEIEAAPGQTFSVRGINLIDILGLLADHSPAMMSLFGRLQQSIGEADGGFTPEMTKKLLMEAIKDMPDLVCAVIARAADDPTPDAREAARTLPLAVQADALEQIVVLSIRTDAELKKLQEIVLRWVETMAMLASPALSRFSAGFGKSVSA